MRDTALVVMTRYPADSSLAPATAAYLATMKELV